MSHVFFDCPGRPGAALNARRARVLEAPAALPQRLVDQLSAMPDDPDGDYLAGLTLGAKFIYDTFVGDETEQAAVDAFILEAARFLATVGNDLWADYAPPSAAVAAAAAAAVGDAQVADGDDDADVELVLDIDSEDGSVDDARADSDANGNDEAGSDGEDGGGSGGAAGHMVRTLTGHEMREVLAAVRGQHSIFDVDMLHTDNRTAGERLPSAHN